MKTKHIGLIALLTLLLTHDQTWAQVPGTINYQGRAIVNGNSFTGNSLAESG
jgi:hypothetical protein